MFEKTIKIRSYQKSKNRFRRSKLGNAAVFVFIVLMGAFMALPLLYSIVTAFKPMDELYVFPPTFFVRRPTFSNFRSLLSLVSDYWVPFSRYIYNSLFVSVVGTVLHVIIASMAAFPLAKYKLKLHWLFDVVVMALLFNGAVLWLPQYLIMKNLNIINTYLVYILPILPMPLGLFLMKQFMEKIPTPLLEAAKIDGAGHFKTFVSIVMPQVKPAWMTLIVFAFQNIWNQQPMNMIFDENLKSIGMLMSQITAAGLARTGVSMAASLFVMIPPLLIFVVSENQVIETMSSSGIK